jgi:hypothetical protein
MKKLALITTALVALAGTAHAQAPAATTTTTVQTPAGTTTTTTDVVAPQQAGPTQPVVQPEEPTARDAITGKPVDEVKQPEEKASLRDKVRDKISDEAAVKQ